MTSPFIPQKWKFIEIQSVISKFTLIEIEYDSWYVGDLPSSQVLMFDS